MADVLQSMQNPAYQSNLEDKLASLKDDPELSGIIEEIEKGGPAAMMKCGLHPCISRGCLYRART